jgi:hypothetical protein
MLIGAISFWLPDTILHVWRGCDFNGRDVGIISVVSPLMLAVIFFLAKRANKTIAASHIILALIAGVWLFGGLFMMVSATFEGAGFKTSPGGALIAILLSLLPMYTFIMATYDGALLALLLVTAIAFVLWIFSKRLSLLT